MFCMFFNITFGNFTSSNIALVYQKWYTVATIFFDHYPSKFFHTRDAVDEKDFEVAIDVFLNGAYMVIEEEDRSDRESVYLGRIPP